VGVPYGRRRLSLPQQYLLLRDRSPVAGQGGVKKNVLTWLYSVRPSPIGRLYTLFLRLKDGDWPTVTVRAPDLIALADGKKLPHVYQQRPPRLCLFQPSKGEWSDADKLIDTMIPWSVEWLHYFEIWLRTGDWTGGGEHPPEAA
jgi:hypothetical protein